jgi:anti-sigma regulatory factor (Ser/Thr protein kinase)/RimJ/RimL family protein N-acetyltransferase
MESSLPAEVFAGAELARLRVAARRSLIPGIALFVREVAEAQGFSSEEGSGLELGTEELCANVVAHAYEGDEAAQYDVAVILEAETFVVAIEDQGVPFDPRKMAGPGKLGTVLARAFADDLRFLYRGRRGKRVELRKRRTFAALPEPPGLEDKPEVVPADEPLTLRLMVPEDAPELARCVWRVFGYSYPNDDLYEPERLAERLRTGVWQCCVAVRASGEILGHISLVFSAPGDRVPESDNAIVAPHARGHHLMERMKSFLAEHGKATGLAGIFSEAVTAHIISQKTNVKMGAVETGLLMGYLPKSLVFKGVEVPEAVREAARVSAMIFYLAVNAGPPRKAYLPARHEGMLREIYGRLKLEREFSTTAGAAPVGEPEFALTESTGWGIGTIEALRYGTDWRAHLRAHLEAQCHHGLAFIVLNLPLADTYTPQACAEAEALGFFFCGVVPEKLASGDVLRLQYWNGFAIAAASVEVASEWGAKMRDYVAGERKD